MQKKTTTQIIDSRHLKIVAAKKEQLKDAVVFISLDEMKYGSWDMAQLRKMVEAIERIESSAIYIVSLKELNVEIYDKNEFKNKDIVITVDKTTNKCDESSIEDSLLSAFSFAKTVQVIFGSIETKE